MTDPDLDLDTLFREARAAMKQERTKAHLAAAAKKRAKTDPVDAPIEPLGIFVNPDNWREARGVALVHRETSTLLGNFRELLHKTVPGARRLVRISTPITVAAVEYVDFGLPPRAPGNAPSLATREEHHVTSDLILETPQVRAQAVPVIAVRVGGWIERVLLAAPTVFTEGSDILELPAGVDVFPVLTRESQIAIKAQLV